MVLIESFATIVLHTHQNKTNHCTIVIWDSAIYDKYRWPSNCDQKHFWKGVSQLEQFFVYFENVLTTETECEMASKTPSKHPPSWWYSLLLIHFSSPSKLFIYLFVISYNSNTGISCISNLICGKIMNWSGSCFAPSAAWPNNFLFRSWSLSIAIHVHKRLRFFQLATTIFLLQKSFYVPA